MAIQVVTPMVYAPSRTTSAQYAPGIGPPPPYLQSRRENVALTSGIRASRSSLAAEPRITSPQATSNSHQSSEQAAASFRARA